MHHRVKNSMHIDIRLHIFQDHLTLQLQITVNWMRTRKPERKKKGGGEKGKKKKKNQHFWISQVHEYMEGNAKRDLSGPHSRPLYSYCTQSANKSGAQPSCLQSF